jgi:hypothetical protein
VITVLRPMAATSDPATRSPALFRDGLSSARRELQAGTARRHRTVAERAEPGTEPPVDVVPTADLATQRAGVRAALAELRQHRRTP